MEQSETKMYKVNILINGNNLTFNQCIILEENDPLFIKFIDKFKTEYKFNKSCVMSIQLLKE
jgi:hypothetical protein